MKISFDDLYFNVQVEDHSKLEESIPVIFLHGFTGSSTDWNFLDTKIDDRYTKVGIDLIGHGKSIVSTNKKDYSTGAIISHLHEIITQIKIGKFILAGYSMGGRAALSYCLKHPENVQGLILESSTAGIVDKEERLERRNNDKLLADKINEMDLAPFIDYWMSLPIFNSMKKIPREKYENVRINKLNNSVIGLQNTLSEFSTGNMPNYWDRLKDMNCKTLLISGGLDEKYNRIMEKMSKKLQQSELLIVNNTGHNVHLENPDEFIILVNNFLNGISKDLI